MKIVKVLDKDFVLSIKEEDILERIKELAKEMNLTLKGEDVVFLGILNGCFMFASDLFKQIDFPCSITFLKLASYNGTNSTGKIKELIGINENIKGKTMVILEDIIDTGNTLAFIIGELKKYEPKKIITATLLHKPEIYKKNIPIEYVGFQIPNEFVLGYGMDYNGLGRNLKEIYVEQ